MKIILIFLTSIMLSACTDNTDSSLSSSITVSNLKTKIANGESSVIIKGDLVGLLGTSETSWVEIEDDTGYISAYITDKTEGFDDIQISIEVEAEIVKSDPSDLEVKDPFGKEYNYKIIWARKIRDFD